MGVNDHDGGAGAPSPQSRYYDRYLQDTGLQGQGGGGKKKPTGAIAGGVAVAVLLVGGGIYALTSAGDSSGSGSPTSSQAGPSSGSTSGPSSAATTNSSVPANNQQKLADEYGPATRSGWTIQAGNATANAAYDLPDREAWTAPNGSGTAWGWQPKNSEAKPVIANTAARYAVGFCASAKNEVAGFMGFVNVGSQDPVSIAPEVAKNIGKLVSYDPKTKKYAKTSEVQTQQVTVNGGKTPAIASLILIDRDHADGNKCEGKKYEARTIAFSGKGVTTMFMVFRNLDAPSKMPDQEIADIVNSVRPKK